MANVRNGNSHYVDSTGTLTSVSTVVLKVFVTTTAANAVVVLQDTNASTNKIILKVAADGSTEEFELGVSFPTGVKVATLTNAIMTVVYN